LRPSALAISASVAETPAVPTDYVLRSLLVLVAFPFQSLQPLIPRSKIVLSPSTVIDDLLDDPFNVLVIVAQVNFSLSVPKVNEAADRSVEIATHNHVEASRIGHPYIDRHTDGWENWVIVEPFLKRCVVHFGHTVDYVSRVLVWRHLAKGDLDTAVWGDILAAIIDRHGRIGNDSEVCWAEYASAILGYEIAAESANHIVRNCGALSIVSILNCVEEGLTGLSVFASARERMRLESANGAFWPVILEWKSRQWRGHKHVNVGNDVIDSLVSREALLFDITRLPLVFKDIGKEDFDVVENAIEDRPSMYDDDAPSDQGEDEDNF
jgi:hypothetical protein